jgi:uncharacterized membrane protein
MLTNHKIKHKFNNYSRNVYVYMCVVNIMKVMALIVFFDLVYFYFMNGAFNRQILAIQGEPIAMNSKFLVGAGLCYILLAIGLHYFILSKKDTTWKDAFLLGLVIYGVFDTTNYSLLKKWDWRIMAIDGCWGAILFSIVFFIFRKYGGSV